MQSVIFQKSITYPNVDDFSQEWPVTQLHTVVTLPNVKPFLCSMGATRAFQRKSPGGQTMVKLKATENSALFKIGRVISFSYKFIHAFKEIPVDQLHVY